MKNNVLKSLVLTISLMLVMTVMLVSVGAASTQTLEKSGKSGDTGWSAFDNLDRLHNTLMRGNFDIQQGVVEYVDLLWPVFQHTLIHKEENRIDMDISA